MQELAYGILDGFPRSAGNVEVISEATEPDALGEAVRLIYFAIREAVA